MTYKKPEVRDFGPITDHTYFEGVFATYNGGSVDLPESEPTPAS